MDSSNSQNVIVMRHGDRIDHFEPLWVSTAARPWDPPLIEDGLVRAFRTGLRIRSQIDFPIHRVFVSPFIRCVQTASEVVTALSAISIDPSAMSSKDVASIDPSKIKVAVEYGLCEMLNTAAIRADSAPKDGNFNFNISELEAMFPSGMVDPNVERVYKEMPQWGESVEECRARYVSVVKALAEKYPKENLLMVTHGEGVGTVFSTFHKNATVYEVDYCGYVELKRAIPSKDGSDKAVEFEVIMRQGRTGIHYRPSDATNEEAPIVTQTPI